MASSTLTWSHPAEEKCVQRQVCEAAMQQQAGEQPPRLARLQHCKEAKQKGKQRKQPQVPCKQVSHGQPCAQHDPGSKGAHMCLQSIILSTYLESHHRVQPGTCTVKRKKKIHQITKPHLPWVAGQARVPSAQQRPGLEPLPARCLLHTQPAEWPL